MKLLKILIAAGGAALLAGACGRTAPEPTEIDIAVRHSGEGVWRISYRLSAPAEALRFGPPVGEFRRRDWSIETPGAHLVSDRNGEMIVSDSRQMTALDITVREAAVTLEKDYQPFYPFSDGGVLFYTGHFDPDIVRDGAVAPAEKRFAFFAEPEESVLVFDRRDARIAYKMNTNAHPFFAYFGSTPVIETESVAVVVDPDVPDWIGDVLEDFIPRLFAHYRDAFGLTLTRKPNVFLASALDQPRIGFSFNGDALPGQFQATLAGDGWRAPSEIGGDLLAFHVAHEAAHLWQNLTQPVDSDQPGWIHEGGADAIAAEALVTLGLWTPEKAAEDFALAARACADSLERGALNGAPGRGDYKALYACGRVMAVAVARAEGEDATVADFWARLIKRSRAEGGYSDALFFALVEARTGRPELARALRRFARTPFAEPDEKIAELLALAGGEPGKEPFPLEPDAAR